MPVPLNTSQTDPHPGRLSAHEARRLLEHARDTREAQLRALEQGEQSEQSTGDRLNSVQATAIGQALKEIGEAFTRIDDGTYGVCLGCSKTVPVERLEIFPYTRYCVACQRRTAVC